MGRSKKNNNEEYKLRPALTPEAEESQMIALSYDLAKKQLLDGTASNNIIIHFLKLSTKREQEELEIAKSKRKLLDVRREAISSTRRSEEKYEKVLNALRTYAGYVDDEMDDYETFE